MSGPFGLGPVWSSPRSSGAAAGVDTFAGRSGTVVPVVGDYDAFYEPITAVQTLTDGATIAVDWSLGSVAKVTLGGARTLGTPTNATAGRTYTLVVIQDGTGDRSLDYPSAFAQKPECRRQAGQTTVHRFYFDGTSYNLVSPPRVRIPCTANTSNSVLATPTDVTGMAFTPVPNGVYAITAWWLGLSAAITTGLQAGVDPGNAVGGIIGMGRGSTAFSPATTVMNAAATSTIVSLSVPSSTLAQALLRMDLVLVAGASPTQIKGRIVTEVDTSQVTAIASATYFDVERLA